MLSILNDSKMNIFLHPSSSIFPLTHYIFQKIVICLYVLDAIYLLFYDHVSEWKMVIRST